MVGWVKLHREIEHWKYFKNSEIFHLFCFLILKANHKDNYSGDGTLIKRGQLMTSYSSLSEKTGLSESKIFRITEKLKIEKQIEKLGTSKNTIITIVNYEMYQSDEMQSEMPVKSERKASEMPVKTNKNVNNAKNEKNGKNYNTSRNLEPSTSDVREGYKNSYYVRYGIYPVWSVKENSLAKKLVASIGLDEAKRLAEFYPNYRDRFHEQKKHPFALLVSQVDQVRVASMGRIAEPDYGNPYTKQLREIERLEKLNGVKNE